MKILVLYDHSGPKYHRLFLPCLYMPGIELMIKSRLEPQDLEGVDILFFNRVISGITILQVLRWRDKYGFKMIVDFDDHWRLGSDHLLYDEYKKFQASDIMEEYIKLADAVTVTHKRLANEVRPLNKNVHVLSNAIPRAGQFLVNKEPSQLTRLFWAGGITHRNDMKQLARPLQLIKRNKCKFVLGGYQKNNPEWKAMAKIFTTDSSYNTEVLEALPADQYYFMYGRCDIALIPLIDTKFNSNKSNLKILEAANIGSPIIVSKVHPYLDFPDDIVNYVDSRNTWFVQINKLLDNPSAAAAQGRALQQYCNEHYNFETINKKRRSIFHEICNSTTSKDLNDYPTYTLQDQDQQQM